MTRPYGTNDISETDRVFIADIIAHASDVFGVPIREITGNRRLRRISRARMACAYLAHIHTPLSFPAIGRVLGGRDHSTIMNACMMTPIYMSHDETFAANVDLVEIRARDNTGMAELIAISQRLEAQLAEKEAAKAQAIAAEKARREEIAHLPRGLKARVTSKQRKTAAHAAIVSFAKPKNNFLADGEPDLSHEFMTMMARGSAKLLAALRAAA